MAYDTTNPPRLMVPAMTAATPQIWVYTSADAKATVIAPDYITNGDELGMAVGDVVFIIDTATPLTSLSFVLTIGATGLVDLDYVDVA